MICTFGGLVVATAAGQGRHKNTAEATAACGRMIDS